MDAETVLLVDHRKAETGESDVILHQGMGADGDLDRAAGQTFQRRAPLGRRQAGGQQLAGDERPE